MNKRLFPQLNIVFLYHEAIPHRMFGCCYPVVRCSFNFQRPTGNSFTRINFIQPSENNTWSASIIFWCQWLIAFNRDDKWTNQAHTFHPKCIIQNIPFLAEWVQDSTFGTTGATKILFRKCTFFTELCQQTAERLLPVLPPQIAYLIPFFARLGRPIIQLPVLPINYSFTSINLWTTLLCSHSTIFPYGNKCINRTGFREPG